MNIVPFHKTPSKAEAAIILRELVAKGLISWSRHAIERMKQRGINTQQVLTCLAKGKIMDGPFLANRNGHKVAMI